MRVRFWGVTGTIPSPSLVATTGGGGRACGNTTCIEVSWPGQTIIYDAGSGFLAFGESIFAELAADSLRSTRIDLILSHPHLDHLMGLVFGALTYDPRLRIHLWASPATLEALNILLNPASPTSRIYFPPTFIEMKGLADRNAVIPGSTFELGEATVQTMALRHPGGCMGFRLTIGTKSIVLASDHEHPRQGVDEDLARFCEGADVVYTEGQYTRDEYEGLTALGAGPPIPRKGWGHSTMEDCLATAMAAGCGHLVLGHHDPIRPLESLVHHQARLLAVAGNRLRLSMAIEGEILNLA